MLVDSSAMALTGPVDHGDWVSISAIAAERMVSRQAISKRVKALVGANGLSIHGSGRGLRVHKPTFDRLVALQHDPAQDLRNRHHAKPEFEADPVASEPEKPAEAVAEAPARLRGAFDDAAAREKNAKASIAEMELDRRRGELVSVHEVAQAAGRVGERLRNIVAGLRAKSTDLYAAGKSGGEEALHAVLVENVNSTLRAMAEAMSGIAEPDSDPEQD